MLLETIRSPADLRDLDPQELEELAGEIRDFIVAAVAENSGHLGSNLGAVELTLALHRVFDSPRDAILWDTGHQAYVHKIVTGRAAGFEQLRQAGGLSGYPSREESEHDFVENSHASTILSYAYGLAVARDSGADPSRRHIVAVIGDGSLTGGMAYEALNNLGHSDRNVIIVLNDNGRSYAPTVSKLSNSLTSIRLNPVYMRRQRRMETFLRDLPLVGSQAEKGLEAFKAAVREYFQPPAFFETLGVRYVGPVDGHDIPALEVAMRNATEFDGPIVIHVLTQKGRGLPAGRGRRREAPARRTGVRSGGRSAEGGADRLHAGLRRGGDQGGRAREPPRGHHRGHARADRPDPVPGAVPRPLLRRRHRRAARRHRGRRHGHGRAAARRRDLLHVPQPRVGPGRLRRRAPPPARALRLDRAGITGDDGASHHGVYDMALLSRVPGMTVLAPSSAQELQQMLHDAIGLLDAGPVAIRYPKGQARQVPDDQVGSGLEARRLREGDGRVCILAVGKLVANAERAAQLLTDDGIDATVWDVRCCAPLDPTMIADAARHQLVVTCEDGIRDGGVGMTMADHVHHACGTDRCPTSRSSASRRASSRRPSPTASWPGSASTARASRRRSAGSLDLRWVAPTTSTPSWRSPSSWPTGPTPSPSPTSGPPTSSWSTRPTAPR